MSEKGKTKEMNALLLVSATWRYFYWLQRAVHWEQPHSRFCSFSGQFWSTSCHSSAYTNLFDSGSLLSECIQNSWEQFLPSSSNGCFLSESDSISHAGKNVGTRFDQVKCEFEMISPSKLVCFRLDLPFKGDVLFPLVAVHYPLLTHNDAPRWLHLAVLGRVGKGTAGVEINHTRTHTEQKTDEGSRYNLSELDWITLKY